MLFAVCCVLFGACCVLFTSLCLLFVVVFFAVYWLVLVVRCLLIAVLVSGLCGFLFVGCCLLVELCYGLFVGCCLLSVVGRVLSVVCGLLFDGCTCMLFAVWRLWLLVDVCCFLCAV